MKGSTLAAAAIAVILAGVGYFALRQYSVPEDANTTVSPTPLGTPVSASPLPKVTTPANQY